jgi:CHAT domain-containing protein/tetratricopeptide (TPR) repeat protein
MLGELLGQINKGYGSSWRATLSAWTECLAAMERLGLVCERGRILVEVSHLHLIRMDGLPAENIEDAIRAGEKALALVTPQMDYKAWSSAKINLAIAYRRRKGAGAWEGQEKALLLLLDLVENLSLPEHSGHADILGLAFHNLGSLYLERLQDDREDNLEQAIHYGEKALLLRPRQHNPRGWALTIHNLALSWGGRFRGDRSENVETAIRLLHESLEVRDREATPWEWADSMNALGSMFADRIQGNRIQNLQTAIDCYELSLAVRRCRKAPVLWAESQINRALALLEQPGGNRASNIERSIRISRRVLDLLRRQEQPFLWALAASNLGQALQARLLGDRAINFEESVGLLESALEILDRNTAPREWARVLNNLGNGYSGLHRGDWTENLEKAVALYKDALEVRQRNTMPWEWAETAQNLAGTLLVYQRGDRSSAIEEALSLCEECLTVYTREADQDRWAVTLETLGVLYQDRYEGVHEENVEKAISLLGHALEVHTRAANPFAWAFATMLLGTAYWRRGVGHREQNLEQAIFHFQRALEVRTRRQAPFAWAEIQNNLGLAWAARQDGDLHENRRRAVRAFKKARSVCTLDALPHEHRRVCRNLGSLYFLAGRWRDAASAYAGELAAGDLLYTEGATPEARRATLWERLNVPLCAAFALAKRGRFADAVLLLERTRSREVRERLERGGAGLLRTPELERSELLALRKHIEILEAASRRLPGLPAREYLPISQELRKARSAFHTRLCQVAGDRRSETLQPPPVGISSPIVYLLTTLHGSLALVLHPEASGDKEIDALFLGDFREPDLTAILQGGPGRVSFLEAALTEQKDSLPSAVDGFWTEIRDALVIPLVQRLRDLGYEQALLVPCGPLSLLPLSAMALDEMGLSYTPSASIVRELAERPPLADFPRFLAVSNPPSSAAPPLPLATLEAEACAIHFSPDSRRLFLGRDANRGAVLGALPGASHLHFACHGTFNLASPLESALLLAGKDCLTVRDLLDGGIDLSSAQFAVLSACRTAMSDQEIPDELQGFPSALLQAGVPVVLGTLWSVGDIAASLLLSELYRRHLREGEDPARALRGAQAWLRDGTVRSLAMVELLEKAFERSGRKDRAIHAQLTLWRRRPKESQPFKAPYHWAGFVIWGMAGRIEGATRARGSAKTV